MPRTRLFFAFALLLGLSIVATPAAYLYSPLLFPNSPPTANGDSYTLHGSGVIGSVLVNDTDPDPGNVLSAIVVTTPTHGSISTCPILVLPAQTALITLCAITSAHARQPRFTFWFCREQVQQSILRTPLIVRWIHVTRPGSNQDREA